MIQRHFTVAAQEIAYALVGLTDLMLAASPDEQKVGGVIIALERAAYRISHGNVEGFLDHIPKT